MSAHSVAVELPPVLRELAARLMPGPLLHEVKARFGDFELVDQRSSLLKEERVAWPDAHCTATEAHIHGEIETDGFTLGCHVDGDGGTSFHL